MPQSPAKCKPTTNPLPCHCHCNHEIYNTVVLLVFAIEAHTIYFPPMWSDHTLFGAHEPGMHPSDQMGAPELLGTMKWAMGRLGSLRSQKLDLLNQPPLNQVVPTFYQTSSNQPPFENATEDVTHPLNQPPMTNAQPENTGEEY